MRKINSLLIFCFFSSFLFAQNAVDTMRYVDFHIHTSYKNYYRDIPYPDSIYKPGFVQRFETANNINFGDANWSGNRHHPAPFEDLKGFSGFFGEASYPQASFDILCKSPASILCTSISPLEKLTVSAKKVKVRKKILGFIPLGKKLSIRKVSNLLVTKLDMKRLGEIDNPANNSFKEFMAEYTYLTLQKIHTPAGKVKLVKDHDDLVRSRAEGFVCLVLSLEGGHILYGPINNANFDSIKCDDNCYNELKNNILAIKNLPHRVLFLTPSHLTWNKLTGFAKGFDADGGNRALLAYNSKNIKFREDIFHKEQQGVYDTIYKLANKEQRDQKIKEGTADNCECVITGTLFTGGRGFDLLRELLDLNNIHKKPVLIDMRHMDVQARREYIDFVAHYKKETGRNIPLMFSHAAVSGKTEAMARYFGLCPVFDQYEEITDPRKFYGKHAGPIGCAAKFSMPDINDFVAKKGGWFHPWSINLFDEEIRAVYESEGIIGVTLEERVLGTGRINYTPDHYKFLRIFLKERKYTDERIDTFILAEPLIRNILYIVANSGFPEKIRSWEHIAIGSDLDGIINSIDICPTAADIPRLYTVLARDIPSFAAYNNLDKLLCQQPIEVLLNKLFYQNGERFILDNF